VYIDRLVRAGRWNENKRTGQPKRSQNGYIAFIWGEAPIKTIYLKNCVVGDVLDVITCTKFQMKFSGVSTSQGVKFSIFLLIFEWALQQCSAAALPVINRHVCDDVALCKRVQSSARSFCLRTSDFEAERNCRKVPYVSGLDNRHRC